MNTRRCYVYSNVGPLAPLQMPSELLEGQARVRGFTLPFHPPAITSFVDTVNSIKYIHGAPYVWHYMEEGVVDCCSCCMQCLRHASIAIQILSGLVASLVALTEVISQKVLISPNVSTADYCFLQWWLWHPGLVSSSVYWTGQMLIMHANIITHTSSRYRDQVFSRQHS